MSSASSNPKSTSTATAATQLTTEAFLEAVVRSGLVADDQLSRITAEVRAKATPEQPCTSETMGNGLVEAGLLTRWQCEKLLSGRHRGFWLGKYKLLRHLGSGGMSAVYLAEHVVMKHRVAIKVLPAGRADDKEYVDRFEIEARAAANLNHPNVARAFDIDRADNNHFIVMEYVEGRDLDKIIHDKGPLDYGLAANYIAQAASGLAHAHGQGLVHRDIKPSNLLVDTKETVKVVDFGLAKLDSLRETSLTETRESVLGTADYLAPEQALSSHAVDSRGDIYSLGCTFYFLLTGHPPFNTGTLAQRLLMHQNQQPPSIRLDRPDAPEELLEICAQMMAKSRDNRIQTAQEVTELLNNWVAGNSRYDLERRRDAKRNDAPVGSASGGMTDEVEALLAPLPGEAAETKVRAGDPTTLPTSKSNSSKQPTPAPTVVPVEVPAEEISILSSMLDEVGALSNNASQITCPLGHPVELPWDFEGETAVCGRCGTEFPLPYGVGGYSAQPRSAIGGISEERWLQLAVGAAVLVGLFLLGVIIYTFTQH